LVLTLAGVGGLCACAQVSGLETRTRVNTEPPCTDFFFPIYFSGKSTSISGPEQQVIANAGRHSKTCDVAEVEVIGLADYRAAARDTLDLSRQRARAVERALEAAGLPPARFHVSPLGEDAAIYGTGQPVPLRNRADVFIRFMH
jgi:outer membrane protein OmpA-like peptidoglycan-associated protein